MTSVFHLEKGAGQPIVLIHGFCESHKIWEEFYPSIAEGYKVLIPDLPGFGNSPILSTPFTLDQVASAMWAWLDEVLPGGRPLIVGHSLGGYVTLAMARQREQSLAGLCLFHSTAKPDTPEKKENRNKVIDFVTRMGVAPYIETYVPGLFYDKKSPSIKRVYPIAMETPKDTLLAYTAAMRDRPDQTTILSTFADPFLIIGGEKDDIIPLPGLKEQAGLLKKGQLSVLAGVGHMGMYELPVEAKMVLKRFAENCHWTL